VRAFTKAAEKLQKQRFLLEEDVERYIAEAEASSVLVGVPAEKHDDDDDDD